jgi:hypothetical protein
MYFVPMRAKYMSRHGCSGISQRSEISLDTANGNLHPVNAILVNQRALLHPGNKNLHPEFLKFAPNWKLQFNLSLDFSLNTHSILL